jgi:hypothetical protein
MKLAVVPRKLPFGKVVDRRVDAIERGERADHELVTDTDMESAADGIGAVGEVVTTSLPARRSVERTKPEFLSGSPPK